MSSLMTPSPTAVRPAPAPPTRPRRRRRWLLAVGLLLALLLGRAPLLRGLAGLLIIEEPDRGAAALVLMDRNLDPERVAEQVRASAGAPVLRVGRAPGRL